jgi:hypothetical protein
MTQTDFDAEVVVLIGNEVRFGNTTALLRKRDDPAYKAREEELMMLQNVIYCLRDYDVTSGLLEDDEILKLIEIGTKITLNWPR